MHWQTVTIALCLAATLSPAAGRARAQSENDSVEEGRQALEEAADFPWYNEDSDSLRPIEVEPTPTPEPPRQMASRKINWPKISWAPLLKLLWWSVIVLLVVGLVVLVIFAVRYLSSGSAAQGGQGEDDADLKSEVDRIENLPFSIKRPFTDLLSAARRAYEAGNYDEAIVYLFSYQLVHLDKRRLIRLAKGKTNRQYVRELRPTEGVSALLVKSMLVFEEVFFGKHTISRSRFEDCWNRLDEFHHVVDQHTAA